MDSYSRKMADQEKEDLGSDKLFESVMHEGDLHLLIPGFNYASSLPETEYTTSVLEDSEPKSSLARRKSTGNLDIPYTRVKILSRYLASSSSGSCHDHCKYGTKQAAETRPWKPSFDRIPETEGQDARRVIRSAAGNMQVNHDSDFRNPRKASLLTGIKIMMSRRLSLSPRGATTSADQGDLRKPEANSRFGKGKVASSPALKTIAGQPNIYSSSKQLRNGSDHEKAVDKASPATKETGTETRARLQKKREESAGSSLPFRERRNVSARKGKASAQLASPSTVVLRRARNEALAPRSPSSSSSKTLRRAGGEPTASGPLRPSRLSSLASPKPTVGAIFKRNGMNKVADPRAVARSRIGKGGGGTSTSSGKASPVRKLKFRGGKPVEHEFESTPSSRRLTARRQAPGCSQVGKLDKHLGNLKPAEPRETGDDSTKNEHKHKHEQVVLREPDAKETIVQNLLNNVIEATASKLAEENNSKVQVLVGAFETVISLQDPNQAPS